MPVRVRDLEIALVLAREMKAAAERSVDASLRLDQLQEVFGVEELDRAERARIQTALQMAGLEPFPSLLEAEPSAPIRFGASKAVAAGVGAPPSDLDPGPAPAPAAAEEPAATEAASAFPTVGQFARSKLRSRRFGVRRGDHGAGDAPYPPVETNGHLPDEAEIHEAPEEEFHDPEPEPEPEPIEAPREEHEPVAEHEPEYEAEPVEEREYIPLAEPEPVAYEAVEEQPPVDPAPQPAGARPQEVVAVLLPAVAIPVIVTSIAGWRFGLPFVALTVIASGWLLSRRSPEGEKRGLFATVRRSPAAATALKVTAVVTALSVAASIVLVSVNDSSSNSKKTAAPAKKAQPPVASKPAKPPATANKKKSTKHRSHTTTPPTTPATPSADPATQGLIRVPPSSSSTPPTSTTPSGPTAGGSTP
jgi:hypothetical protein